MSTVCYCGQPDCPVTTWERDACVANLRAERDALKAQVEALKADVEAVEAMRQDTARRLEAAAQMHRQAKAEVEAARSHLGIRSEGWARSILDAMDEAAR